MKQKDIDIYEILKDVPEGTSLYTKMAGKVEFTYVATDKEEEEAKEQPAFKTFDKVLVRCGKGFKWLPAFFIRDRGEDFAARFNALPIHSGHAGDFTSCIPYEGNENIAFTDYDIENLPF